MQKPPFRNEAVRMPTTVGSGASGSGSIPSQEAAVRMPTTVGAGPSGGGGSALPPGETSGFGKRMPLK